MNVLAPAWWGLAAVMSAATCLWLVSLVRRDASLADPFWAPGFFLVAAVYLWRVGPSPLGWIVVAIVAIWAMRLGTHLMRRNLSHGEDPRYAAWRERYGRRFWWVSLFTVFWLQAALLWIVSAPLLGAIAAGGTLGASGAIGASVALAGIWIEATADRELRRFRARENAERAVLDTGLWRYSRHPNYFGNAVLWWGLWVVAVGAGAWWTLFSPLLMTLLLLRVSGVTLLERRLRSTRPGYEDYVRRTSAFVPWPPSPEERSRRG